MDDNNEKSLRNLIRAITLSQGNFSLILCHCNYHSLRQQIMGKLSQLCPVKFREIILTPQTTSIYETIRHQVEQDAPLAVIILELEKIESLNTLLLADNNARDAFRDNFSFPVVIWVTTKVTKALKKWSPDLLRFSTAPIELKLNTTELLELLQTKVDKVFEKLLDCQEHIFLDNAALNLAQASSDYDELDLALQEIQPCSVCLYPELEAGIEFVLGWIADKNKEISRFHYEKSLDLYQNTNQPERQGLVLFYLGFWWRNYGIRHLLEKEQSREQAQYYFQQSLNYFKRARRFDLVANYINFLADTLHRSEQWNELEDVAWEALGLYQRYKDLFKQARSYGFLAEVAREKNNWSQAEIYAQNALSLFREAEVTFSTSSETQLNFLAWQRSFNKSWYLFSLGTAQYHLNQLAKALKTLTTVKKSIQPAVDPVLYINILETLHKIYFKHGDYLKAFQLKQEKQRVENQFDFQAFIGVNQLQPKQGITNTALSKVELTETMADEIIASGRDKFVVGELFERLSRDDCKLTIIHGPSGVGKSSTLQAGLIPYLKNKIVKTYRFLPVILKVYQNWEECLGENLKTALVPSMSKSDPRLILNSTTAILNQLKQNSKNYYITVLIFDQFEEFFIYVKPEQKTIFYKFLLDCLDLSYVKVIVSLREDYLHELLEFSHCYYDDLSVINNDILSKNTLLYLGDLQKNKAEKLIKKLTVKTQFYLENELIERLVNDLEKFDKVRPIELQVVGLQLQRKEITTLKQYEDLGENSKAVLVNQYLEEVVQACGTETLNKDIAELILYLLTDEQNLRPLKTCYDLEKEIKNLAEHSLDYPQITSLVLDIFVNSRLVVLLQDQYYQLAHDYLVSFIRQRRGARLEEERKIQQESAKKHRKYRFWSLVVFSVISVGLSILFYWQKVEAERQKIEAYLAKSNAKYQSFRLTEQQIEAYIISLQALKTNKYLQNNSETQKEAIANLWNSLYFTQEINRLEGHTGSVLSVSVSPDGQIIASGGRDGTIRLWNQKGEFKESLPTQKNNTLWIVKFNPNLKEKTLISGSADKTIKFWSREGKLLNEIKNAHTDVIRWIDFNPDGDIIASASNDTTIKLWKVDGTFIRKLEGHKDKVLCVVFSPDGKLIASASEDGIIKLWTSKGELIKTLEHNKNKKVSSLSFSPDNQILASASDDKTVKLWNKKDESITILDHSNPVNSVIFSNPEHKNEQMIITADNDGQVNFWSLQGELITRLTAHRGSINQIDFIDNQQILVSASSDGTVRLWELERMIPRFYKLTEEIDAYGATFTPDGLLLAASREDNTVKLWDLQNGTVKTPPLTGHKDKVNGIAVSRDGMIATASDDQTIKLWTRQGELIPTKEMRHDKRVNSVSFSSDSQMIATASDDNTVKLWNLKGELLDTLTGHNDRVNSVIFHPDSKEKIIASASSDGTVRIWNTEGKYLQTLDVNRQFSSISFSPDGTLLAAATSGGFIKLWQKQDFSKASSNSQFEMLSEHKRIVYHVSFSQDKDHQVLASASKDGTVKLWTREGHLLANLYQGNEPVESVYFNDKGKLIAISADSTIRIWNLEPFLTRYQADSINETYEQACDQLNDYIKNHLEHHPDPYLLQEHGQLCPE